MTHHYWSDRIPKQISQEIGDAIRRQAPNLPVNLFAEWFSPVRLEKSWFEQASKYIDIPYPEYWASGEESVELAPPEDAG